MFVYAYSKNQKHISVNCSVFSILRELHPEDTEEQLMQRALNLSADDLSAIKQGVINALRAMTNHLLAPTDYLVIRSLAENVPLEELNPEAHELREGIKQLYNSAKSTVTSSSSLDEINCEALSSLVNMYIKV